MRRSAIAITVAAFVGVSAAQAAPAPSARGVVAAASKAMGADGLNGIQVYGVGANYNLGQSNHAGGPWPDYQDCVKPGA